MVYESPVWKDAYQPGAWESLFPAILHSKQGSSDHVKKLIAIGFSCITFLRNVFPQSVYQMCVVDNLHVALISEDSGILCPNVFVDLLYSAFEAIDKQYLKKLSMIIFNEPCNVIQEVYTFKIKYLKDGQAALTQFIGCSDKTIDTKLNVKGPTMNLLRSVIVLTQSLLPLPDNIAIRFYLDYYESETPSEYHPRGYMAVDPLPINFHDSVSLKIGGVKTLFHSVQLLTVIQQSSLEEAVVLTPDEKVCNLEDFTAKGGDEIPLETPGSENLNRRTSVRKKSRYQNKPCKKDDTESLQNNSSCKPPGLTDSSAKPTIQEKSHQGPDVTPTSLTWDLQSQKGAFNSSHAISKVMPCSTLESSYPESPIRCPCGLGSIEELMLRCSFCGFYQHGACFKVLEAAQAPSPHVCELCASFGRSSSDYCLQNPTPRLVRETCILRRIYSHLRKVGGRHTMGTLAKTFGFGREIEGTISCVLHQDGAFFSEEQPHTSGWLVNMSRISSVLIPKYFQVSTQRADHNKDKTEGSALLQIQQAFKNINPLLEDSTGKNGRKPLTSDDKHQFEKKDQEVEDLRSIDEESLRLCGSEISEYSLIDNTLDISAEEELTCASQDSVRNNSLKIVLDKQKNLVDFLEEKHEDDIETESIASKTIYSLQSKHLSSSLTSDSSKLPDSDIDITSLNMRTPKRNTVSRCQSNNISSSFVNNVIHVCQSASKKHEEPNNDKNSQEIASKISAGSNVHGTGGNFKQDLHGDKSQGSSSRDNSLSEHKSCSLQNVSSFHHCKMNDLSIFDQGKADSSANSTGEVYNTVRAVKNCSKNYVNARNCRMTAKRSVQENVNIKKTAKKKLISCKTNKSVHKQNISSRKVYSEESSKTNYEGSNQVEIKDEQFKSVTVNKNLTMKIPSSENTVKNAKFICKKPRKEHTTEMCKEGKPGIDDKVSKDSEAYELSQSKAMPQNRYSKALFSRDKSSQSSKTISKIQSQSENSCSHKGDVNEKHHSVTLYSTIEQCDTSSCVEESHLSDLGTKATEKLTDSCDVTNNHSEDRHEPKENNSRMGKDKSTALQEVKGSSPIKIVWNSDDTAKNAVNIRHDRKFTKQRKNFTHKTCKDNLIESFPAETPRKTQAGGSNVSKYSKRVVKESRLSDLGTKATEKLTDSCDITNNHSEDRHEPKENNSRMGKDKSIALQEAKGSSPIKIVWNSDDTAKNAVNIRHDMKFTKQRKNFTHKTRKDNLIESFPAETTRKTQAGGSNVSKYSKRVVEEKRNKVENSNINIDNDTATPDNTLFGTTTIITPLEDPFHKYTSSTYKTVPMGESITCSNKCGGGVSQCDLSSCLFDRNGHQVPNCVKNSAEKKSILKKKIDDDLPVIMAEWKDDYDDEIETIGKRSQKALPNHGVEPRPKYLKVSDLKNKPRSSSLINEDVGYENDKLSYRSVNNSLGHKIRHDKGYKFVKSKVQMKHTSEKKHDSSDHGGQSNSYEGEPTPIKGPKFFKEKAFRKTSSKNNCSSDHGSQSNSYEGEPTPIKGAKFFKEKAFRKTPIKNNCSSDHGSQSNSYEGEPTPIKGAKFFKEKAFRKTPIKNNCSSDHGSQSNSYEGEPTPIKGAKFFKEKAFRKTPIKNNCSSDHGSQSNSYEGEPTPIKGPKFFKEKAFRKASIKNNCSESLLDSLQPPYMPKKDSKFFKSKAFSNSSLTGTTAYPKVKQNTPKFIKINSRIRLNKTADMNDVHSHTEEGCSSKWTSPNSSMVSTTTLPKFDYIPRHQQDSERHEDESHSLQFIKKKFSDRISLYDDFSELDSEIRVSGC